MIAAMRFDEMKANQGISLKQLLGDYVAINCLPDVPVTGMSLDSRKIESGNIFVALAGQSEHGLAFAELAVSNGAVAVLCDRKFDEYCQQMLSTLMTRTMCVPIDNLKERLGEIASQFYDEPSKKLSTVGVTGTDGKTSVSHFIAQAFGYLGQASAVMGTIGNGLIGDLEPATHTTPDVIQVHKLLANMVEQGATQITMEVSSHGLDQRRIDAVEIDVAVLTNLGRDHLDYHGDIEAYAEAKKKLFQQKNIKTAVLNMDDEFGRQLVSELNGKVDVWGYATQTEESCGIKNIVSASSIKTHGQGLSMRISSPRGEADVNLNLMGRFNVSNVLATLTVLLIKNIEFSKAIQSLEKLVTVPGRMQVVAENSQPVVVVDYAHTPQALESALKSLKEHSQQKLICVFGCGGDRDEGKRPLMAKMAEAYADEIIVTDDNPRTEDAEKITNDIFSGFNDVSKIKLIHDRKQAISQAIKQAGNQDIILLAGKGHEDYQIIGDTKNPFSDVLVAKACLEDIG
jgi:UDP-N-acetylmuramoyl-L-alanyl-D-glutamate--2,6-diaminopimelate ligase